MENAEAWDDFKKWWIGRGNQVPNSTNRQFEVSPLISQVFNVTNTSVGVIDIQTMQYSYLSPNFAEFTGWKREQFLTGGVQFAFTRIHGNDVPGVLRFSEMINAYFKNLSEAQRPHYRTFWDYRIKNDDGIFFKIIQQDCVLSHDDGNINEFLFSISKIDSVISEDCQHLRMADGNESHFYKYDHSSKSCEKLTELTKREIEIAKLIAKSHALKEIAAQLEISFNTVKSHTTNMMDKLKVNNSLEMINVLRIWGFL